MGANSLFDNVTFAHYSDVLLRTAINREADFDRLRLANIQFAKRRLPYLKNTTCLDTAVCLMIEAEYLAECAKSGRAADDGTAEPARSSESLEGHSVSWDTSRAAAAVQADAKPLAEVKTEILRDFCGLYLGVF